MEGCLHKVFYMTYDQIQDKIVGITSNYTDSKKERGRGGEGKEGEWRRRGGRGEGGRWREVRKSRERKI
jgi:hypothetical protein